MEIYSFYGIITTLLLEESFRKLVNERLIPVYGCVGGILLFAIVFILQGIGISKMAKDRGLEKRWMAFTPFVNIWYLGKLSGDGQFFGQRMKRTGLYAMLGQILATLVTCMMIAAEVYLFVVYGAPKVVNEVVYWPGLTGFAQAVEQFYNVSGYLVMIFQLVCEVLLFVLLTGLFKQYAPRNYSALSILCLLFPLARFFTIFALRNRKAVDFNAYMRARQEAYARQRQQAYYDRYGNPYGNAYGQNPSTERPKPEEPFAEFSSHSETQTNASPNENTDGFFD